ncbi:conserved hypothetical protein [Ricinus communis]|uniref:Uncharacterized protein n=1 Tax=Ricinus communis TaxID=3988 RepID=B9T9Q0_RICCO|nr:conserved hypothetical protein [Ricinus communis]
MAMTTLSRRGASVASRSLVVTMTLGCVCSRLKSRRKAGESGSIGRNAPPALRTARIATIVAAQRDICTATTSPGPTPSAISRQARRLACSSSTR